MCICAKHLFEHRKKSDGKRWEKKTQNPETKSINIIIPSIRARLLLTDVNYETWSIMLHLRTECVVYPPYDGYYYITANRQHRTAVLSHSLKQTAFFSLTLVVAAAIAAVVLFDVSFHSVQFDSVWFGSVSFCDFWHLFHFVFDVMFVSFVYVPICVP